MPRLHTSAGHRGCSDDTQCREGAWDHPNIPITCWQMTDLHQELAEARRALTELESEREQKQRDFDRKLLLAKSRIETEEASPLGRAVGSCQTHRPSLADPIPAGGEGPAGNGGAGPAAEDALPAGAAGAGHQTEGVPGEGDPAAEQGRKLQNGPCHCFASG